MWMRRRDEGGGGVGGDHRRFYSAAVEVAGVVGYLHDLISPAVDRKKRRETHSCNLNFCDSLNEV